MNRILEKSLGRRMAFVGGLSLTGLGLMNPILAALAHNAGSLLVVFNSAHLVREGEELDSLLKMAV